MFSHDVKYFYDVVYNVKLELCMFSLVFTKTTRIRVFLKNHAFHYLDHVIALSWLFNLIHIIICNALMMKVEYLNPF